MCACAIMEPLVVVARFFTRSERGKNHMKKRMLAISILVPVAASLHAETPKTKIRVINTGAVLEGSTIGKEKMEMLEAKRRDTIAKLETEQKKVVAKEEEIKAKGSAISQAAREKLDGELTVAQAELRQKYETANAAWQEEARKETAELKGMLDECVKKVADAACTKEQCDELVVLDQLTGSVLYATPKTELTADAVKEMDKKHRKTAAARTTPATMTADADKKRPTPPAALRTADTDKKRPTSPAAKTA